MTEESAVNRMRKQFIETAVQLALENVRSGQGGPFAALVVKSGKIVATRTNRVVLANDPTSHAEINSIREACRILGSFQLCGCEIYASCEPCPMCLGAIYWARADRVFFAASAVDAAAAGFDDLRICEEFKLPMRDRKVPLEAIRCEATLEPFQAWQRKTDRIPY
jgi:guanine deaminase